MYARYFKTTSASDAQITPSQWLRQFHRWVGIVFTLTVIANFVVRAFGEPPPWITYSPLPPLFLQLFSGLYMFFRPYVAKRGEGAVQS